MIVTLLDKAKKILTIISVFACVVTNTLPRWIHPISFDTFVKLQAISFIPLAIAAVLNGKSRVEQILISWCLALIVGNAIDEVYGVADKNSIYELIFAAIATGFMIWKVKQAIGNKM